MRDAPNRLNMRSTSVPVEKGEISAALIGTPEVLVLVSARNLAQPVDGEDETQIALPVPDERARNVPDAAGMMTEENVLFLQARSQVEALTCANRRKNEFLAMLSHELSSPLAAIQHAVRFMGTEGAEAATQQRMQALIERQLTRMTVLIEELREVSRIASGHLHLQRERVDLRDIVRCVIETLEWEIEERTHRLSVELPDVPVWLRADRRRLEQVFVNLLANASRYTDAGGDLTLRLQVQDGQAVTVVRNSGIGIAPESLRHLFDLFKQGDPAEPRSGAGPGVGLAVVRNLIELHRGSVVATSDGLGRGSEFTVRLPIGV
jgi:signal transduction histidine kinase